MEKLKRKEGNIHLDFDFLTQYCGYLLTKVALHLCVVFDFAPNLLFTVVSFIGTVYIAPLMGMSKDLRYLQLPGELSRCS